MPQSCNIASHLPRIAERHPDVLSVVVQHAERKGYRYEEVTAAELEAESNRLARGLLDLGIVRGTRTVLMVTPSVPFFTLTFALFKIGAVPVVVDPGMGIRNLKKCLAEAKPEAFIGIPKAHAARVALGWGKDSVEQLLTVGRRYFWGGATLHAIRHDDASPYLAETAADETAAILFTSGSTGTPKGAVYTHGNFDAQVTCLRQHYGIEPGERDLSTFPLFALFGPALGMASIVPDMDASKPITANPAHVLAAAIKYETTNFFASPALIRKIGAYAVEHGATVPTLKRVISAGAPASMAAIRTFSSMLLKGVEVFPSYGATEALPIASIGSEELLNETAAKTDEGAGVCVGRPLSQAEVRIVAISDEAIPAWTPELELPEGEVGEIAVRGPMVTVAYYNRPEGTALAKIPCDDGTFFHRMGDLGYRDGQGRLWFCGRKGHRVTSASGDMYTICVERTFDTVPGVARTALVGVGERGAERPVLCVELEKGTHDRAAIESALAERADQFAHTQSVKTLLFHPAFPLDVRHNAKIHREALRDWAERRIS